MEPAESSHEPIFTQAEHEAAIEILSRQQYGNELAFQIRLIRLAWDDLLQVEPRVRAALDDGPDDQAALDRAWYSVSGLLAAANRIRLILWPTAGAAQERGRRLRELLAVGDDFAALRINGLRHTLEHYDERMDAWFLVGARYFADRWVVRSADPVPDIEVLRRFNIDTKVLSYMGTDALMLEEIVVAAGELCGRLHQLHEWVECHWDESSGSIGR